MGKASVNAGPPNKMGLGSPVCGNLVLVAATPELALRLRRVPADGAAVSAASAVPLPLRLVSLVLLSRFRTHSLSP